MCVIINLAPNAVFNKEHLFNAVYNNWQGFGLVIKDANGHLDVIREFDPKGTDPQRVWDLLEQNKDCERFLHVRFTTKGESSLDNTQPFEVYNSNNRRVIFMHNGTLNGFGPSYNTNNGKSDTLEFVEKVLQPALLRWVGEKGKGDYTDPEFSRLIIEKQWTSPSKGLFVSNDLDPLRIGPQYSGWSKYENATNESNNLEVWVSNKDYFDKVTRGPEFERRKREEEKRKEEERRANATFQQESSESKNEHKIKHFEENHLNKDPKILRAINAVVDSWQLDDPMDLVKLSNVTYEEWLDFISKDMDQNNGPYVTACVVEQLARNMAKIQVKLSLEEKSHKRAQLRLENIAKVNKKLVEESNVAA